MKNIMGINTKKLHKMPELISEAMEKPVYIIKCSTKKNKMKKSILWTMMGAVMALIFIMPGRNTFMKDMM